MYQTIQSGNCFIWVYPSRDRIFLAVHQNCLQGAFSKWVDTSEKLKFCYFDFFLKPQNVNLQKRKYLIIKELTCLMYEVYIQLFFCLISKCKNSANLIQFLVKMHLCIATNRHADVSKDVMHIDCPLQNFCVFMSQIDGRGFSRLNNLTALVILWSGTTGTCSSFHSLYHSSYIFSSSDDSVFVFFLLFFFFFSVSRTCFRSSHSLKTASTSASVSLDELLSESLFLFAHLFSDNDILIKFLVFVLSVFYLQDCRL